MHIEAQITGIKYKVFYADELKVVDLQDFNINQSPAFGLVKDRENSFALSKWVSPKRTRSYPFERVYNTLNISKKITVIPIVKDEGFDGDRDFIQWDTISLMSLLDVYVILAYYDSATKNSKYQNKITSQKLDNEFVTNKIEEIKTYHSSALHWNLKEINQLSETMKKVKESYEKIEKDIKVSLHSVKGLDGFQEKMMQEVSVFMDFSRKKAKEAQAREQKTIQPKEILSSATKATITIENYLGGQYFLTTDEVKIEGENIFLIESKHSKNALLPSKSDIKDGLVKMILYCNLEFLKVDSQTFIPKPILQLTSTKISGEIKSSSENIEIYEFLKENKLNEKQKKSLLTLFREANENGFEIRLNKI